MAVMNENGLSHLWAKIKALVANVQVVCDSAFLSTSENAVQNKVITQAVTTTDGYLAGYTGSFPYYNEPIVGSKATAITILKSHEDVMCQMIDDISSIKSELTNVYTYKGSVASASDLPTNASVGDVYDIKSASVYGAAGANVAWNGTAWDSLGEIFSVDSITNTQIDEICV